jgi:hypothetical protein
MVSLLEIIERSIGWRNLILMILMRIMALENFSSVWIAWSWAERALRKFSAFRSGLIQGNLFRY